MSGKEVFGLRDGGGAEDALLDVPAPAKINLFLHVVGRRADGYHLLQTAFRFVDLCDRLDFALRDDGRIVCENTLPGVAPENDLIFRAATALREACGVRQGTSIRCRKTIPAGGGLGGGSSDAATTLIALNRLWRTGLTRDQLLRLALPLGADVPIFVFGRPAFAEGIGERLSALPMPERAYVIIKPAAAIATASVFSHPDLTRDSPSFIISVFADWLMANKAANDFGEGSGENSSGSICSDGKIGCAYFGRNDLEPVVLAENPGVRRVRLFLDQLGFQSRMTGSGACFFVEFATLAQARMCQQKIAAKIAETGKRDALIENTWVCQGLNDHPLRYWID